MSEKRKCRRKFCNCKKSGNRCKLKVSARPQIAQLQTFTFLVRIDWVLLPVAAFAFIEQKIEGTALKSRSSGVAQQSKS